MFAALWLLQVLRSRLKPLPRRLDCSGVPEWEVVGPKWARQEY